jgi:hypothetical protein
MGIGHAQITRYRGVGWIHAAFVALDQQACENVASQQRGVDGRGKSRSINATRQLRDGLKDSMEHWSEEWCSHCGQQHGQEPDHFAATVINVVGRTGIGSP